MYYYLWAKNMADQISAELLQQVNFEMERYGKLTGSTADALRDAQLGVRGFTDAARAAPKAVGQAASSMASAMYKGEKGATAYNNAVDGMADAASNAATVLSALIPGGPAVKAFVAALTFGIKFLIKSTAEAEKLLAKQGDALFTTYQKMSAAGAVAAGGTKEMGQSLYKMGLSFEEADQMIQQFTENSEDLALFGGSVYKGAQAMQNVVDAAKPFRVQLESLGLNQEAQNEAIMGYIKVQTRLGNGGKLQAQGYEATAAAAAKYIAEQDALTKVTGITRKAQEKALDEAMRNARFAATVDMMRANNQDKAADQLTFVMQAAGKLGPKFQKGMTDLVNGIPDSDEAAAVLRSSGGDALKLIDMITSNQIQDQKQLEQSFSSMVDTTAQTTKGLQSLYATAGDSKSFVDYSEARRAIELAGDGGAKLAKVFEEAREQTKKQLEGEDERTRTQAETAVLQRQAMLDTQRTADLAIDTSVKAINSMATAAAAAADALYKLAAGAQPNEKQKKLAADETAAKKEVDRTEAASAASAAAVKQAEAAAAAERATLKEAQSQSDKAKNQLQGVGGSAGINSEVELLKRKEREAASKVDSAGTEQDRKKAQEVADNLRLQLAEKIAEQGRLQVIVAEQGRKAEDAKLAVAQREAVLAEAKKKDADAKKSEDTATHNSLRAQYRSGMSGERPSAQAEIGRQAQGRDTAALGTVDAQLTVQQAMLKANTDQMSKLDKTRDKATVESLERVNETITKRTKELEKEAEVLKKRIESNRPGGAAAPAAPGGRAAPAGGATAAPAAAAPVGGAAAPASVGGAAAPGRSPTGGGTPLTDQPNAFDPNKLLNYLGQKESQGKYDMLVGKRQHSPLTSMTVAEVMKFQDNMISGRGPTGKHESTAVGKYQIVKATMEYLLGTGAIKSDDIFNSNTQDRAAMQLLKRRGMNAYMSGKISKDEFADRVAKEWSSMPLASGKSAAENIGSNKALASREEYLAAFARDGGMFSGPMSGYPATLHGPEAVIPLKNGAVPVTIKSDFLANLMPKPDMDKENTAESAQDFKENIGSQLKQLVSEITTQLQQQMPANNNQELVQLMQDFVRGQRQMIATSDRLLQVAQN